MPRYKLVVQEVHDVWYEVEGENEEEAYEMYYEGDGEMIDQQWAHTVDDTAEIVENLDETDAEMDEAIKKGKVFGAPPLHWWDSFKLGKESDEEDIL